MVDFWRMIWETNANRIVMVTNLYEMGKSKVEQYWPSKKGTSQTYGDIEVTLDEVLGLADHTVHTLSVTHKVQKETRKTWQLHFTSWPDKGIPRQAAALLSFRSRVHSYDEKGTGPLVVHCSAGVGRTGTYIALDILLEQVKDQDEIDIFTLVLQLREQRMMMVQTQDQYVFLHDALIEQLYSKDTPIPTPLFREQFNARLKVNPQTGKNELQEEFERLAKLRVPPTQEKCEGLLPVNKHKNRDKFIVPPNNARAFLMTPVEGRNNYINAVFVDGHMAKDSFLVTQHPLADTVVDLWRMIYDYKCQTVVMLNQTDEKDVPYWPSGDDTEITVEPFKIEVEKVDRKNPAVTIRTMELTHTGRGKSQKLRHFHFHGWSNKDELPPSIPDFISLMEAVSSWYKETLEEVTAGRKQMVVHCLDGNSKSGLFCVVYSILDQIRVNQDVNIFQAVRLARMNRYQFITSVDQYKFCYEAAQHFLNQFETYANFAR